MLDWAPIVGWLSQHGGRILLVVILSVTLYYVLRHFVPIMIRRTVSHQMRGRPKTDIKKRVKTLSSVLINTGTTIIAIVAIFTILAEAGVNITPALAGLGIAGVAIGFGAQSLVKDIFNGLLILLENQYGVGDVVQVAGVVGLVEEVSLRRTVLRDLDGIVHSVPNSEVKVASNFTKEWSRVNMNISVGYGEDLNHVIEVINRVGEEITEDRHWSQFILKAPQVLRVDAFEDSGIAIKICGDTKPLSQWDVMGELRLRLKKAFDEAGIEIPWPHIKVYFANSIPQAGAKTKARNDVAAAGQTGRQNKVSSSDKTS
jgi:small-conductance mechanosensitive channel